MTKLHKLFFACACALTATAITPYSGAEEIDVGSRKLTIEVFKTADRTLEGLRQTHEACIRSRREFQALTDKATQGFIELNRGALQIRSKVEDNEVLRSTRNRVGTRIQVRHWTKKIGFKCTIEIDSLSPEHEFVDTTEKAKEFSECLDISERNEAQKSGLIYQSLDSGSSIFSGQWCSVRTIELQRI